MNTITNGGVEVLSFRGNYYVSFKSPTIQRWAARVTKSDQYYVLTGSFWRAATGEKTMPKNAKKIAGGGTVMYFDTETEAHDIANRFISGLEREGVL